MHAYVISYYHVRAVCSCNVISYYHVSAVCSCNVISYYHVSAVCLCNVISYYHVRAVCSCNVISYYHVSAVCSCNVIGCLSLHPACSVQVPIAIHITSVDRRLVHKATKCSLSTPASGFSMTSLFFRFALVYNTMNRPSQLEHTMQRAY